MTDWILPPLVPGNWIDLSVEEERDFAFVFSSSLAATQVGVEHDFSIEACRAAKLDCYRQTMLVEVQARLPAIEERGIMSLLYAPDRLVILDGQSAHLHDLSDVPGMLLLDTHEAARDYLQLFCNTMLAEEGRFQVVTEISQVQALPDTELSRPVLDAVMQGFSLARQSDPDHWLASVTMLYGDSLFRSEITVDPATGAIEMVGDSQIESGCFVRERRHLQFRLSPKEA